MSIYKVHNKMIYWRPNTIALISFYTAIFAAYLGTSLISMIFASVAIFLTFRRQNISIGQSFALLLFLIFVGASLILSENNVAVLKNHRFYFGFILYYFMLRAYTFDKYVSAKFFRFICYTIIVETVLVNTMISPELLPNYPIESGLETSSVLFGYIRPMSFTGNASMSATMLVVMYYIVKTVHPGTLKMKDNVLMFINIILFMSGTGFAIYLFSIAIMFLKSRTLKIRFYIILFLTIVVSYFSFYDFSYIQKLSPAYYYHVISKKLKIGEDIYYEGRTLDNMLFGEQLVLDAPATSGDYGWNIFITVEGFIGVTIFIFLIFAFIQKKSSMKFPILLMLVGALHYPGIFTQAGQLLFAYALSVKKIKYIKQEV